MAAPPTDVGDHRANMHNPTEAGTTNDRNSNKRNIFPWADLPAELRNQIYELTLTTTTPVALRAITKPDGKDAVQQQQVRGEQPLGLVPNLLLINKATYAEGAPLLYANHIYFNMPKPFFVFLGNLSPTPKAWLRELTLRIQPTIVCYETGEHHKMLQQRLYLARAFTSLAGAANLQRLHLDMSLVHPHRYRKLFYIYETFEQRFYKYAKFWLEAFVIQKGGIEPAVEAIYFRIVPKLYFAQEDRKWTLPDYDSYALLNEPTTTRLRMQLKRKYLESE